jgi:uncharacterized membrane protein
MACSGSTGVFSVRKVEIFEMPLHDTYIFFLQDTYSLFRDRLNYLTPCTQPLYIIIIIIIITTTGTITLCEPWPSSGFLNNLSFTM